MKGIFGSMFDFNGDGELDAFEQATEFMFIDSMTNYEKVDFDDDFDDLDYDFDDEFDVNFEDNFDEDWE